MLAPPVELGAENVAVAWALPPATLVKDGAPGTTTLLLLPPPPQEASRMMQAGKMTKLLNLFICIDLM
jgi:hypothetical protein